MEEKHKDDYSRVMGAIQQIQDSRNAPVVIERDGLITYRPSSTNIKSVEYVKEGCLMIVAFANGSAYRYFDVPESRMREFISAPSAGQFFSLNIRNVFKSQKL